MPLVHCQCHWLFEKYFLHFYLNIYVTLMWEIKFKLNAFKNFGEIQIIRGIIKKKTISCKLNNELYRSQRFNVSNASLSWTITLYFDFSVIFGIRSIKPQLAICSTYCVTVMLQSESYNICSSKCIFFIFILVWQIQDREVWKTAIPKRTKRFGESRWLWQVGQRNDKKWRFVSI